MLRRLAPYLGYLYVSLVGLTSRTRYVRQELRDRLRAEGTRFIYAVWHQRQVFITWTHRGDPAGILVSRSQDGEIIAEIMRLSRLGAVRGSSSRGGAAALKQMLEIFESGRDLGITPDGPKGPAREIKDGVIFLAQKLGAPILPMASATSNRIEIKKAWDRFHIPLPFSRAAIVYGEPVRVGPQDDPAAKARELKERLDLVTQEADGLVA